MTRKSEIKQTTKLEQESAIIEIDVSSIGDVAGGPRGSHIPPTGPSPIHN